MKFWSNHCSLDPPIVFLLTVKNTSCVAYRPLTQELRGFLWQCGTAGVVGASFSQEYWTAERLRPWDQERCWNTTCWSFFGVLIQAKFDAWQRDIKHQGLMKDDDTRSIMMHFEFIIRSCEFPCFAQGLHLVRHCAAWGKALISVRSPVFVIAFLHWTAFNHSWTGRHLRWSSFSRGSTGAKPLRCESWKLIGGLIDVAQCKGPIHVWHKTSMETL